MAAPCVSRGAAASYRLFLAGRVSFAREQGLWKAVASGPQTGTRCQILRLKHSPAVTTKKNVAALRRESYTVDFIKKQIEEFNLGKRHLANMMGEDPETFTQEDVDEAYGKVLHVEERQDQLRAKGLFSEKPKTKDPIGSRWLIKEELEEMLVEKLSDQDYAQFIRLLERLSALPCDASEEEFVGRFRRTVTVQSKKHLIEPLQCDDQGLAFSTGQGNAPWRGGKRKTANAEAVVYGHGSGKIEINGVDYLLYFPVTQDREQLMFPFHFLDRLGKHDVTCTVSGGGRSSQAGAIRLAVARALCSFITEDEVEWMRQAGLLTTDPRVRERKKPGQEGARRKFTWKKR
ncbi:28S ribosomal protein S9, mitochondrial isoform X3 [Moschus berezovskii]|uniref:28S ribosomal protein S9, mitochondrial isoform X3 n=1 Tax=Moschus berezovskii TaxID=68408 RepID=UPI002444BF07|nr:28S ribosomal protein S9, mitochondrial isoform X3 [Moschus berezovskii]